MKYSISKRYALVAVVSVLAGSLATVGVVKSAVPHSQTGNITACYRTSGSMTDPKGNLRVVDTEANESCENDEVALDWNAQTVGHTLVNKFSNANLGGVYLQFLNLDNVSFQNSQLIETSFTGSSLKNANFSGSYLETQKFNYLDASGANFSNASVMIGADQSTLHNTNFSSATIRDIAGGDFTGADFTHASFGTASGANFTNVDFRYLDVRNEQSYIANSDLTGANLSGVSFVAPNFGLIGDNLTNANFSNAVFSSENVLHIENSNTTNTNFTGTAFTNVMFLNTDLSSANLTNATWANVVCPDTTNSNDNGNTCIGHLALQ